MKDNARSHTKTVALKAETHAELQKLIQEAGEQLGLPVSADFVIERLMQHRIPFLNALYRAGKGYWAQV